MRVRVPASSANLGPGYDSFGLALALHDELEAELADTWAIDVRGEGAGALSRGADNQVLRAMARLFAEAGRPGLCADVVCHNGVPVGVGLGSSSAAIVGGLVLADALIDARMDPARLLAIAAEMEGHADNVAAALHGGFTVTVTDAEGPACVRVEPAGGLAAVVVLGQRPLLTAESRGAVPAVVPHADAAANAGHAALVALGLALGEPAHVRRGLKDRIHEPYRTTLIPDLESVRALFEVTGIGPAVLSGAGPTVLALVQADDDAGALVEARRAAEEIRPLLDGIGRSRVMALGIDRSGAVVS